MDTFKNTLDTVKREDDEDRPNENIQNEAQGEKRVDK